MRALFVSLNSLLALSHILSAQLLLPPTVVEAEATRKDEEPEQELLLTGNTTRIDSDIIAESGSNSVADLLQFEAGLATTSFFGSNNVSTPILRGFGENSQLRTLILVDGLSVARDDLAVEPFSQAPLANLESISVLRGGRTVRYGSGASAGVIALKTKRGDGSFSGSLSSAAGSDDTFRQRISLNTPLAGWDLSFSGEDLRTNGFRENSAEASTAGSFSLLTPEADWGENRISISFSDSQFEAPGPLTLQQLRENSEQSFQDNQEFGSQILRAANSLEWKISETLTLNARGSWVHREREAELDLTTTDFDSVVGDGELVLKWQKEQLALEAGLRGRLSDAEFVRLQPLGSSTDIQLADLQRETLGGFLIVQGEPVDGFVISAGASWDRYQLEVDAVNPTMPTNNSTNFQGETDENGFAYELGLEYQITEHLGIWARYDRSLRFPVLDEVGFFQGFPSDPPFNSDLSAERIESFEIGLQWKSKHLEISSNVFSSKSEDEIFFNGLTGLNENLPEISRLGWESKISWQSDHWRFNFFYDALLARFEGGIDDGNRVPLVPRNSFSASSVWSPTYWASLGLEVSFQDSSPDGNDRGELGEFLDFEALPSRTVWNLQARLQPKDDFTIFCRINNLFDRSFATTAFSGGFFPAPGRQLIIGGKYEF